MRGLAGSVAVALALLAAAARVQAMREHAFPAREAATDALYIASPTAWRRLTAGYNALASDVYWIRAIQYYGGTKRRLEARKPGPEPPSVLADTSDFDDLYAYLDITTSLDPRFDIAYRFGAVFLAEPYPTGAGRPDLAIRLLEKGLRERPDKWQYMEDIGFVHYWYYRDYRAAASAFERASRFPGAPRWLQPLAATTLAQGGDRRTSRAMWLVILQSADVDWLRTQAEWRLQQFRALDEIDALQARVEAYGRRAHEPVHSWTPLIAAGVLRRVPTDPGGTPYEVTVEGRVKLSESSTLLPLPTER